MRKTSWQRVASWYSKQTQDKGHYYHEHIIIPRVKKLLHLTDGDRILDLACGAGVLGRSLPKHIDYVGVDIAPGLIQSAAKQDTSARHTYTVADVTKEFQLIGTTRHGSMIFSHAVCVLAIQNVQTPEAVFANAFRYLEDKGTFVVVMNHPAFRIPRQSSWGIDETNKMQYRKINRYMSPLEIPMTMHPAKGKNSPLTWSYHFPLGSYVTWLVKAGFVITGMEEWTSDKESEGKAKKMEDRSRSEIPLFLMIEAKKVGKH